MEAIPNQIPTCQQLIQSLSKDQMNLLYKHFEGAAQPDKLIYQAWLWANGWIHDAEVKSEWIPDLNSGELICIEVLDLDKTEPCLTALYDFWLMKELETILRFNN